MGKKGFLLQVGLFVLVAAACATSSSTPGSTASGSPKDAQPASTAALGTLDDLSQSLTGEWRGWFTNGFIGTLIIYEVDIANKKARCRWFIKGTDLAFTPIDNTALADFIPGPSPKLILMSTRFNRETAEHEFVLKNNKLEGSEIKRAMFGSPRTVLVITMEKYPKK